MKSLVVIAMDNYQVKLGISMPGQTVNDSAFEIITDGCLSKERHFVIKHFVVNSAGKKLTVVKLKLIVVAQRSV